MTAKIISFPKRKKNVPELPDTELEARQAVAEYRMKLINDMVNTRFTQTMKDFTEFGFPVNNKEFLKNVVFSNEMLRAVLYYAANIHHPMIDDVIKMRKDYENGLTALSDIDRMFEDTTEEFEDED